MSDLIRREDAIKAVANGFESFYWDNIIRQISSCVNDINNIPAVEAVEEKTGVWEKRVIEDENPFFRKRYYCSYCGGWNTYGMPKYCPHCGAKMDKE